MLLEVNSRINPLDLVSRRSWDVAGKGGVFKEGVDRICLEGDGVRRGKKWT